MAQFSVKKNNIDSVISTEGKLANELNTLSSEIRSIGNSLSFKLATSSNIRNRLNSASSNVSAHRTAMKNMRSALQEVVNTYDRTENTILGRVSNKPASDKVTTTGKVSWFTGEINAIKELHDSDLSDDNPLKKLADKLNDFNEKRKRTYKKGYYDKDGNYHDVKDADKNSDEYKEYDEISSFEKVATIVSAEAGISGSVWKKGGSGSYGIASGSYNVSALNAEAKAEAYAGLYSFDENGNKKFTPGIGASVGVGVSAFKAGVEGAIGNEYYNVHGSTSVEVLAANAGAELNVGLYKDGKLNPQLSASASAEAILAEASATVGGTIAGAAVNATGSVNFGVGAHADVGLRDGKLSVDIGASLGVGVSVKFDVDFSGTAKAIGDKVSSGLSKFCGLFK